MLPDELIDLAQSVQKTKAEGQAVEVKSAHQGCPKRLYDTLSAFSNQDHGGVLLFGLDEASGFRVVGVYDVQDLQKKVTEQCLQMEPKTRAVFTAAEYQGVVICSAEIPAIDVVDRPCYYAGAGRTKGSYIRVGDADLPMTDYEIYRYEAFRRHQRDDERIVERATFPMLNTAQVEYYLSEQRIDKPLFAQLEQSQAYELLNITRDGTPTLAAVMNFSPYPQAIFPQLCITAVVVPGLEMGDVSEQLVRFLDNKRIDGSLNELVEGAIAFCKRNMKSRTIIDPESGKRADKLEYPITAIREAVLNAVIHRDYSIHTEGTPVQIIFFQNRLEIHSPGSLYGRLTVDQLGQTHPDLRNPTLATMAERLTGSENRYSGIPTMHREMREAELPAPKFENRRNEFVVILFNNTEASQAAESLDPLLEFCKTPKTRQEIANFLGVSTISYMMRHYITPKLEQKELAMTLPEKPQSRLQRYYTVNP